MNQYVIAVILCIIGILGFGTFHYHSSYIDEITKNAVLTEKNKELIGIIQSDSDAVAKLAKESKEREDGAKAALASAQIKFREALKRSQGIIEVVPADPNNLCKSSDLLFNQYLVGR